MPSPRKRGAQPGNLNALKTGFYSQGLNALGQLQLSQARELSPADLGEEIAIFRQRLLAIIAAHEKGEVPLVIEDVARLGNALARLVATHFHMGGSAQDRLVLAVNNVMDDIRRTMGA